MIKIEPFRFTIFSDPHNSIDRFGKTLDKINDIGGVGDFIIGTGDYCSYPWSSASRKIEGKRDIIDSKFGVSTLWFPAVGNHDVSDFSSSNLNWIKNEFENANGSSNRIPLKDIVVNGPEGARGTQYYFIHKGIMFVILNPYWTGVDNTFSTSNPGNGGQIVDETISWLEDIFQQNSFYKKFIFCHSNAFGFSERHVDVNSLFGNTSEHKENRDRFWRLMDEHNGMIYFHGHTHIKRIDYVSQESVLNSENSLDSWDYPESRIPHISNGGIEIYGSPADQFQTFANIIVSDDNVTVEQWSSESDLLYLSNPVWNLGSSEIINYNFGKGQFYYKQDKPGTIWYDKIRNDKGWTVDFNLRVFDIQNNKNIIDEKDGVYGAGVYVNDGVYKENLNFLKQEIVFSNSKKSVVYDTTVNTDYRLIGKDNKIELYAKKNTDFAYEKLIEAPFYEKSFSFGNSYRPSVFEDVSGNIHVVWIDDSYGKGSLFYSKFENNEWSYPENVVVTDSWINSPSLIVDSTGIVYISFEDKKSTDSKVGLVYRNSIGWSDPYYENTYNINCVNPKLAFDSYSNLCVVWEGIENDYSQIYLNVFYKDTLSWGSAVNISNSEYSSFCPSISSYMDNMFVSWTEKNGSNNKIKISRYNFMTKEKLSPVQITNYIGRPDSSYLLAVTSGRVFCVWHDDKDGKFNIYGTILNPSLDKIKETFLVVDNNGGSKYPVLSEQISTGYVYIVWQDYKELISNDFSSFNPSDDNDVEDHSEDYAIFSMIFPYEDFGVTDSNMVYVRFSFEDNRNVSHPSVPLFFNSELPFVYESLLKDDYLNINKGFFSTIRCSFYNLNNSSDVFNIGYDLIDEYGISKDLDILKNRDLKEIRFGDFSNILSVHYAFKNFKIYSYDAVPPFYIEESSLSNYDIQNMTISDVSVNNYGDVLSVGPCGIFYYIKKYDKFVEIKNGNNISMEDNVDTKLFKSIAVHSSGTVFIAGGNNIYYSLNIDSGFKKFTHSFNNINVIEFDKNDNLFVGTSNGLQILSIKKEDGKWIENVNLTGTYNNTYLLNAFVSCIEIDNNNCIWIGSYNGLFRYYNGHVSRITTSNGLSSSRINDIAIRNTAIRYVATPNGINKMVGLNIDKFIKSDDGLWNDNVKSLLWRDPNILFAGTLNKMNQISFDENDNFYSTSFYTPSLTSDSDVDFRTYYIVSDENIEDSEVIDIYINGNKIKEGYSIGGDSSQRVIRFEVELMHSDIVEVVVRKDMKLEYNFNNFNFYSDTIKVKDLSFSGDNIYVATSGDINEVKINDFNNGLPYDSVHLDTTPPHFIDSDGSGLKIDKQINKSIVKLLINGATDVSSSDSGSGIDRMIVSNYSNFTTDGSTPKESIPFQSSLNYDMGLSLDNVVKELSFDGFYGSCISYFNDVKEIYAGTSNIANLYKYDIVNNEWNEVAQYGNGESGYHIDFIYKYNNDLLVGVGRDLNTATLYVYDYSSFLMKRTIVFSESRCFCLHEINGKLYIGTGIGNGDGHSDGIGDGGCIYYYNDGTFENVSPYLEKIVESLDDNVYALASSLKSSNILLASTGESGYIYEVDLDTNANYIIHNDSESIISMASVSYDDFDLIFAGVSSNGIVKRAFSGNNSFDISFKTTPSPVKCIKVFPIRGEDYETAYASIGSVLYYFSVNGTWVWKYTHTECINDISYNNDNGDVYVISDGGVTKVSYITGEKKIYLKLIDRAGNEASYPENKFSTSISISDLTNFVNENRLLELDEFGNILYSLDRGDKFYSGSKINEEKGVYESEIFDGTSDLVKWDTMSWEATRTENTDIKIYVRTSNSRNDILLEEWSNSYSMDYASGLDLSTFSGRYFQFKVELISREAGVSPVFYRASVKSVNSESVHFFTTNFTLPSRVSKGIISSQKIVPVSSDIVFGINTTDSVDWSDYQEVDENRLFNVSQIGENIRVGIKFISPQRQLQLPYSFDEYGPYDTDLFVNTVEFSHTNNSGQDNYYHFRVTFYSDYDLNNEVFSAYSTNPVGFNIDDEYIPDSGYLISDGDTVNVRFSVPGYANLSCNEYYFVKVEYICDSEFLLISDSSSFILSCSSTFVDDIVFDFENNNSVSNSYHFRIRFYENVERINLYKTVFSGNDIDGWFVGEEAISEDGVEIDPSEKLTITYRSTYSDFEINKIYYLVIDVHDGDDYVYSISSYTFQVRDVQSLEYCGEYVDVPIVKNFGIMFELENKDFVNLNR